MEDMSLVAECNSAQELEHERFDFISREGTAVGIHVLFEVLVHIFKYEHELVFGVDDIVEADDVVVFELLHEGDFANGGGWCAFFRVEMDLFEGDGVACCPLLAFEDGGIRAALDGSYLSIPLSKLFQLLVVHVSRVNTNAECAEPDAAEDVVVKRR
jgi:hypothetical protein